MRIRSKVIGIRVDAGDLEGATTEIVDAAEAGQSGYICVANVHMLVTARRDDDLRGIIESSMMVTSDGMPLLWRLRSKGLKAKRVAGPDLFASIGQAAARRGVPIYYYGGQPQVVAALQRVLADNYPGLPVAGIEAPTWLPDKPEFDADTVGRIVASGARIVFVGLGCPKQERWMARHTNAIPAILIGVGAAFDFAAGTKKRAPKWMCSMGLEWFYRLISEPGRLWHRYLTTNSAFLWILAREIVTKRR